MVFLFMNEFYMSGYFVLHWVLFICFLIISFCCMKKNDMIDELSFLFDRGVFSCEWMSYHCHVLRRVLLFSLFLSHHFVAWLKRCFYFFLIFFFILSNGQIDLWYLVFFHVVLLVWYIFDLGLSNEYVF